ncbi:MAG: DUF1949 domain-containing protein, partial [Corynebacterium sp.]|nr:DUF1949 domain-containing protein [Corynebacterium sp.]
FGGVKLGTGGLVRAYSDAVSSCLRGVVSVERELRELYAVEFGHDVAGRMEAELRGRGFTVADIAYGANVTMTIALRPGDLPELSSTLAALTQGKIEPLEMGSQWVENTV